MSSNPTFFSPLKRAVLAFFKHDVTLRRDDGRVRLVLEDRICEPKARPLTKAEQTAKKADRELALARDELARVLDDDPSLRSTLRHLAFVEHALEKKGWRGLYKVPLEVLDKALEQLENLVTNWSPEGLAALRSKMAVAVMDREHEEPDADAQAQASMLESPQVLAERVIETAMASSSDDEDAALLAAYAAMGVASSAPADVPETAVELQGELGSRSARDLARGGARSPASAAPTPLEIRLRDLQP